MLQIVFRDNEITVNRNKGKTMKEQKTSTKRNLFLSDLDQSKLQREVEKVMKELTKALIDPLEEARKRLERAQQALNQQMARMQAELTKQTADPHYQIPLGVYLDYGNAKNEYAIAEKEYKRLQREQVKSHVETVEALKPLTIRKKHKKGRTSRNVSNPISTEEQIANSFDQWMACYEEQYHKACQKRYYKWKLKFTPRTLRKNVKDRMKTEVEEFRRMFQSDNEFELVYDTEQKEVDIEGVSRFLFTNPERFGVSHIDKRQAFSKELLRLFNFIDTWRMMQSDLQAKKKQGDKAEAPVVDELEQKVKDLVGKIRHLTAEHWKQHLPRLWKSIFTAFRSEISKAGPHEKFKEYSKKTLYCIIGHLKQKGAYRQISNLELTVTLEGANNGMRKYLNSGLLELEESLRERIEAFVDQEMQRLSAVEQQSRMGV